MIVNNLTSTQILIVIEYESNKFNIAIEFLSYLIKALVVTLLLEISILNIFLFTFTKVKCLES